MSGNPQTQLFKMLAESQQRGKAIADIHARSLSSIPARQQVMLPELNQLRAHIQSVGIGADEAAENQYLTLLRDMRMLDQSYVMGAKGTDDDLMSPDLQKALDYGELLLSVYGNGALVKGASSDLQLHGQRLLALGDHRAVELGRSLLGIETCEG